MMIHEITAQVGSHKRRRRVGRGIAAGQGKTCGRGHKGARSRSGFSRKAGHEGGQMPFFRRFPKRGFSNVLFRTEYAVVNIKTIDDRFEDGAEISAQTLVDAGLIGNADQLVKILGDGETTKKFTVIASKFSKSAQEKVTGAGGTIELVVRTPAGPAAE